MSTGQENIDPSLANSQQSPTTQDTCALLQQWLREKRASRPGRRRKTKQKILKERKRREKEIKQDIGPVKLSPEEFKMLQEYKMQCLLGYRDSLRDSTLRVNTETRLEASVYTAEVTMTLRLLMDDHCCNMKRWFCHAYANFDPTKGIMIINILFISLCSKFI